MLLSLALLAAAVADDPFKFADGDRVVWLGGTLIEREQQFGYWEAALTVKNRPAKVTFRNLGWSGDTVWGESRNGFDESPKGFERLVSLTTELKPTVLIICYGQKRELCRRGRAAEVPRRAEQAAGRARPDEGPGGAADPA